MLVEIFGFDPESFVCKPCINAKNLAMSRKMNYKFYPIAKVSASEEHRANKMELTNRANAINLVVETMPQVFIDGVHIGGFDQFKEWANR